MTIVTVTPNTLKDINNQVTSVTVDINAWKSGNDLLTAFNEIISNSENLQKIRIENFDFKQSAKSAIISPEEMARVLVELTKRAPKLQMLDLLQSHLNGCEQFFKTAVLQKLEVNHMPFDIKCTGIPSLRAVPLANGKIIWENAFSVSSSAATGGFFSHKPTVSQPDSTPSTTPTKK